MKKYMTSLCLLGMVTMAQGADSKQSTASKFHSRHSSIDNKRGSVVVIEQPTSSSTDKQRDMRCIKTGEELKDCCLVTGLMALLIAPTAISCGLI